MYMNKKNQHTTKYRAIVSMGGKEHVFRNSYSTVNMLIKKLKLNGISPSKIVRIESFMN